MVIGTFIILAVISWIMKIKSKKIVSGSKEEFIYDFKIEKIVFNESFKQ